MKQVKKPVQLYQEISCCYVNIAYNILSGKDLFCWYKNTMFLLQRWH